MLIATGAGWLGSELAAASRTFGNHTTVIATAHPADPERFADPGTPLPDLLPNAPSRTS
ncbi:hypothetical protein AB0J35_01050 [Nonomuraea angiospora]|uniref:hypothetical protein n=1 Tax=Nonomuraea angiospora TaxID=46172 RepID=UPI00341CDF83